MWKNMLDIDGRERLLIPHTWHVGFCSSRHWLSYLGRNRILLYILLDHEFSQIHAYVALYAIFKLL